MASQELAPIAIDYPSSDGKPMADNDAQRAAIIYALDALQTWFAERADVYVSGDLLIYYREGDPGVSIAPDVFVVIGAAKHERPSYRLWEEPKAPDFVLEVASPNTWRDDLGPKRRVYERLGVREYWQYDPTGDCLPQRLQGLRLTVDGYEVQAAERSADGVLTLVSDVLGLELRARAGRQMRFHDPAMGRDLLSHREEHARAEREAAARQAAEARVAELEALIRDQRG